MKKKKYLVLGGKGKTGRKVVEKLTQLGKDVRIGSRSETPSFDWEDSSNWADVLKDVDSVYITFQPDLAVPGAQEAIKKFTSEAVKSGVQKLVLLSGKGEKEAEACEKIVMNSGVDWTIARASWFNQNFSESFFLDPILAGHVALPKEEALIPFIDTTDIADVAVEALLNEKHSKQIYELTGPRQLTFKDVVEEIAEAIGRDIHFQAISMDEYEKMLSENNVPDDYIWLIKYLFTDVLVPGNSEITNDVEKVLGRKPIEFSEYSKETAKTGVWNQNVNEQV